MLRQGLAPESIPPAGRGGTLGSPWGPAVPRAGLGQEPAAPGYRAGLGELEATSAVTHWGQSRAAGGRVRDSQA